MENEKLTEENILKSDTRICEENSYNYQAGYELPQAFQCGGVSNSGKYLKVDYDGYVRLAEGTGGTPSSYLVSATKDEKEKTITIIDNNLNQVQFTYGGEGYDWQNYIDTQDQKVLDTANSNIQTTKNELNSTISTAISNVTTQIDKLWGSVNTKSTVSASATGSSTNQVQYLTIDGIEYILPSGGGSSAIWGQITGNIQNQTDLVNQLSSLRSDYTSKIQEETNARVSALTTKQDKLTAGENITIENNVISATGGGSGGDVTKSYVDKQDESVLETANNNIATMSEKLSSYIQTVDAKLGKDENGIYVDLE